MLGCECPEAGVTRQGVVLTDRKSLVDCQQPPLSLLFALSVSLHRCCSLFRTGRLGLSIEEVALFSVPATARTCQEFQAAQFSYR
jgi:hypothetical protein